MNIYTYLRIKQADYDTASSELKSHVNHALLSAWKHYHNPNSFGMPKEMFDALPRDKKLQQVYYAGNYTFPYILETVARRKAYGDDVFRDDGFVNADWNNYAGLGPNAYKYNRWGNNPKFKSEQLFGKKDSDRFNKAIANLSGEKRDQFLNALDYFDNNLGYVEDETSAYLQKHQDKGANDRAGIKAYIDQGFTPDQAFILRMADNRKTIKTDAQREAEAAAKREEERLREEQEQQAAEALAQRKARNKDIGMAAGGAVLGGGAGYMGSDWLSGKLGLKGGGKENDFLHKRLGIDPNSKYRKYGDITLRTLGTLGGAAGGAYGGHYLANTTKKK